MALHVQPFNFSWIVDGVLAGSGLPEDQSHFQFFLEQGIKTVVSFVEFLPLKDMIPEGVEFVHMPVYEFEAPSLEQLEQFWDIVQSARQRNEAVVGHCFWGRGRTGTFLAAYLMKDKNMNPKQAIREVRSKRRYSIETYEQEEALYQYYVLIQNSREKSKETKTESG